MKKLQIFRQSRAGVAANQKGMASIVIVSVLVVILTLVSIGFGRLMNRAINNSTNRELGVAASYAAQSGINDAIAYIEGNFDTTKTAPLDGVATSTCNNILDTGGGPVPADLVSGDNNVQYTCLTINPEPTDLIFGGQTPLPPYKSQVIKMTTDPSTGPLDSLMLSWRGNAGQTSTINPATGTPLYDETMWGTNNYAPVLRVTLYPIGAGGDLSATQAGSRTYYFYPNTGAGGNISPVVDASNASTDPMQGVRCGNNVVPGGFNTGNDKPTDYICSVIINNLAAGGAAYYYARVTPLYDNTDLRIIGNDHSHNLIKFEGVQGIVDSTAKASTTSKRLQARVDLGNTSGGTSDNIAPGDNSIPEFAIDSANAICKRLDVSPVTVNNSDPYCLNELIISQPALSLGLCATAGGGACDPTANNGAGVTISDGATATLDYKVSNAQTGSCSLSNGGPSGFDNGSGSYTTGVLSASVGTYVYTLTCKDLTGATQSESVTVTVTSVSAIPPPIIIKWVWNSADSFTYNVINSSTCTITPDSGGGPTTIGPALNQDFSVTDGVPNVGATLRCYDQSVGPAVAYAPVSGGGGSGPVITVNASCANNTNPGCYEFNTSNLGTTAEQCHDGLHQYIICISWVAADSSPSAWITQCTVSGYGGSAVFKQNTGPSVPLPHGYDGTAGAVAPPNNWWNVTFGWFSEPSGPINFTITCQDSNNLIGSKPASPFTTCFDGSCVGGGGSGGGGAQPSCPPGAGGNSCTYNQFSDCNLGNGQPGGYPNRGTCTADGGTWTPFCQSSDGIVRLGVCAGANF